MIAIKILCDALGNKTPYDNMFVKSFDPDAMCGRGKVVATPHVEEALQFESTTEAHRFWAQASTVQPLRTDGKPNRPLTAYCVEMSHI
jgi:hypothetical protein